MKLRITNLNVRNFGLGKDKPRWEDFQDKQKFYRARATFLEAAVPVAEKIVEKLLDKAEKPSDIFVFQEFDVDTPAGKRTIELFIEHGYKPIYPDKESAISGSFSITMMFVKDQLQDVDPCVNPKIRLNGELRWDWKWCIVCINNLTIVGIHAPSGQTFLDKVQEYAYENREQEIIILGDFNIAINDWRASEKEKELEQAKICGNQEKITDCEEFFERRNWLLKTMLSIGYSDAVKGDSPTYFPKGTTIDHVLVAPALKDKVTVDVCPKEKIELSDHAVIIVEVDIKENFL